MIITAPSGSVATYGSTSNQAIVGSIRFDLTTHTFSISYGPPGGGPHLMKYVHGNIPIGLQNALEAHAQGVIESNEGWAANSSSITST